MFRGAIWFAVLLLLGLILLAWRAEQMADAPLLPLTFAHADHQTVGCVDCHHNFADGTGTGFCIDCHKQDPALAPMIETHFHDLCRDCHVQQQLAGEPGGPERQCVACHSPDTAP